MIQLCRSENLIIHRPSHSYKFVNILYVIQNKTQRVKTVVNESKTILSINNNWSMKKPLCVFSVKIMANWRNKGNVKCPCGSRRKWKKCCKKLEKNQVKSYKNKFKSPSYHNDKFNNHPNRFNHNYNNDHLLIDRLQREIANFKGKNYHKQRNKQSLRRGHWS